MMRLSPRILRHSLGLILTCLTVCTPARADPPTGYPFVDYNAGLARAKKEAKPILLYFGRYGCGWCAYTNRETFSDAEIKRIYTENYALIYVDAEGGKRITLPSGERITEADLGARLGAFATPLFVFMTPEGRVITKIPGYKTIEDFKDFDRYVRDRHYERQGLLEFLKAKP